jgi:hypothetical protein
VIFIITLARRSLFAREVPVYCASRKARQVAAPAAPKEETKVATEA